MEGLINMAIRGIVLVCFLSTVLELTRDIIPFLDSKSQYLLPQRVCAHAPFLTSPVGTSLNKRVVDGQLANRCSWPWMVNIRFGPEYYPADKIPLCSGVLINSNTVVTAAHCLKLNTRVKQLFDVVVGEHDTGKVDRKEKIVNASITILHPHFNPDSMFLNVTSHWIYENDIAVVKLEQAVPFSMCVRAIQIASHTTTYPADVDCRIAGWGKTQVDQGLARILQTGDVTMMDWNACKAKLGSDSEHTYLPRNTTICTNGVSGSNTGTSTSCHGDDGGMLVCGDSTGNWVLRGIIISHMCDNTMPTVYTNLSAFKDWIMLHSS
ncbi:hypothetical protein ScPMuIL_000375 [Solemya velum]